MNDKMKYIFPSSSCFILKSEKYKESYKIAMYLRTSALIEFCTRCRGNADR